MAYTCDSCGSRRLGSGTETVTGRHLCDGCYDRLMGTSVAMMSGADLPETVATVGWYERLRRRVRR